MGVFESQSFIRFTGLEGVSLLVVNGENITEGPVNQVKAKIGADLAQLTVVLNEGTEEH